MSPSPSKVVSTIMRACGKSTRLAAIASTPFIRARGRANKVMSGGGRRNSSMASCKSAASATMTNSGTVRSRATSPWRTTAWSSTIMIRMGSLILLTFSSSCERRGDQNPRSLAGRAFEHQRGVDFAGAFPHAPDPIVSFGTARAGRVGESTAIIFDPQKYLCGLVNQLHIDSGGGGMTYGIRHRLLANAQQFLFDLALHWPVG